MSDETAANVVRDNQRYWEALAPERTGESIDTLRSGTSVFNEHELAAIGDVRGQRVLQLACSVGDEALTFARMGAEVTAVDLAPSHLATGRAKAEALGGVVDFQEQNMMTLSADVTGFDLIFISWGGLCWSPDINAWARLVAQRLNPGGALIVSEHHPLWEVLTVADRDCLSVSGDYFTPGHAGYADPLKEPEITRKIGAPDLPHQSFVWSIGNLITAVLAAGLTIQSFQEFPIADMYPGLDNADRIPATYLLTATSRYRRRMPQYPPPARPLGPDAEGQWVRRWMSPEWTEGADAWVSSELGNLGRRISGVPVTYRTRFWSVVRCYPSVEGLVWFKENNPGHRFEAGLVAALAEIAPYDVIVPLAVDRERGRLLTDDHGTTLTHPDVADQATRRIVVRALARLQCSLLGRLDPAEHPGMLELPPASAGDRVRAVAQDWSALPPGHPLHLGPELPVRAERAAYVLDRQTASLSDLVPLDVEINDVYPANIFADRSTGVLRPRFFDFGNAIWAHPFVTLHGFLDSVVEWTEAPLARVHRNELFDAYLAVWRDHLGADPQVLRHDLDVTEALVGVHRLVSWLRLVPYADPLELRVRAEIPRQYLASVSAGAQSWV